MNFHVGLEDDVICATFSKAKCELSIKQLPGRFRWCLDFGDGVIQVAKEVRLNQEFDFRVPITAETAKSSITFLRREKSLTQTILFPSGTLELSYKLTSKNGLIIVSLFNALN